MGPLGTAWVSLEQMRKEGTAADPATLLRNVEMAVCLLGQALWKTTNRRRLLWLAKFLGDFKKAPTFLKEEESVTTASGKKLFRRAFLKRLCRRAKGTKQASMIKSVLGASKSKKLRRDAKPRQPQPFRGAPPRQGFSGGWRAGAEVSGSPKETRDRDKRQQQQLVAEDGAVPLEDTTGMSPLISLSQSLPEPTVSVPQEPVSWLTKQLALPELKPWDEIKMLPWEPVDFACGPVGGCLQKFLKNWEVVTGDPEILQMVQGVRIQFAQMPMLTGPKQVGPRFSQDESQALEVQKLIEKRAIEMVVSAGPGFLRTPVPDSKEGRVDETSVQSKTTKCVRDLSALQDGGHGNGDKHDRTGRLVLQDRPEGRLLCDTDSPRSSQVPALHLERSGLPVQSAPVWAGVRASNFHKITETSHSTAAASGSQDGPIPRRLHVNEPELRRSKETQGHHAVCLDEIGFHHKLAQVGAGLDPHPGVPGLACQLSGYDPGASTEQGSGYQGTLHRYDALTYRDGKAVSQAGRQINSNSFGSSPRAIVLQGTADTEDQRLAEKPTELWSLGDIDTRVQGGADVVGRVVRAPQWPIFHRDLPGPSDHNRRVEDRLGSSGGGSENTGCMVGRRVTTIHQLPRTESSEVYCDGIHETQILQPCSPTHGQCNGSSLCEQEGGDTITVGPTRNERDMAILPCQEDHSYSRASARQIEYGGGFPIPLPTRQQLLEAGPTAVQDAESAVGPTAHRSVCRPSDDTATNICELETGPGSPNDGCLLMWVAGQDDVRLSTILPDQQMPGEAGQRPGGNGINYTHMAHAGMVPTVADQTVQHSDIVATIRPTTDLPGRRSASISEDGTVTAGGLEDQWQEGPDRALSEDTAAMLLRSRRDGTRKAYQHPWEEWTRWCDERQILFRPLWKWLPTSWQSG